MAKINTKNNNLYWLYIAGFFIILALPLLNLPPWFTPPSYTQAIAFRSLFAILGFIYLCKEKIGFQKIKSALNPRSKIFIPLIALLGYFLMVFISTIFSLDISNSLWGTPERGAGFINFSFFILFFIFTFSVIRGKDWKKLLDFSLFVGFLIGLVAVFQQFKILYPFFAYMPDRPSATLGNTIILALYLIPLCFLALSFFLSEINKVKKYLYLFLVIFYTFVIIFLTQTRAAILGISVGAFWFLITYPLPAGPQAKKWKFTKISAVILPIIFIISIFYLNVNPQIYQKWPKILKDSAYRITVLTHGLQSEQSRISAWRISIAGFIDRPYFGYGPENFYIAFNKHYDPNLPTMEDIKNFDRAHNYLIQIMVDSGIFALIFYLVFSFSIIWKLQKIKQKYPVANGLQAGFIAFFIASLASIDGFSISLIFFFFSAHSLYLISSSNLISELKNGETTSPNWYKFIKTPALIFLFFVLIIFLWQYNFIPLQMNKQIVIAQDLAENNYWKEASKIMDEQSQIKTFFLPYTNYAYINLIIDRIISHPDEQTSLVKTLQKISQKNVSLQPYDYRNWLRLGESLATIAKDSKDTETLQEAQNAFKKALELSPKDPTILLSFFMSDIFSNNLTEAKEKSDYCLKAFPESRECLWMSGLINIYLNNIEIGKKFIEKAEKNGYYSGDEASQRQLLAAYLENKNYKEMLPLYQKLFLINRSQIQYKVSEMLCYKELGNYGMARQLAVEIIKSNPELKPQIESFLVSF